MVFRYGAIVGGKVVEPEVIDPGGSDFAMVPVKPGAVTAPREIGHSPQEGHPGAGQAQGDQGASSWGTAQEGGLGREYRGCPGRRLGERMGLAQEDQPAPVISQPL